MCCDAGAGDSTARRCTPLHSRAVRTKPSSTSGNARGRTTVAGKRHKKSKFRCHSDQITHLLLLFDKRADTCRLPGPGSRTRIESPAITTAAEARYARQAPSRKPQAVNLAPCSPRNTRSKTRRPNRHLDIIPPTARPIAAQKMPPVPIPDQRRHQPS